MYIKSTISAHSIVITCTLFLFFSTSTEAQNVVDKDYKAFSNAFSKILASASNGFADIKGAVKDTTSDGWFEWKSKVDLPKIYNSSITDELVISKYYKAQFMGTDFEDTMRLQYDKYLRYLKKCLIPKGYNIDTNQYEKFAPGFKE